MAVIRVRATNKTCGLVRSPNVSIQMPVSISPAVKTSVVPGRLFPIVNVLMAPQLGLESVCATRMVNAVGLKRNVRQHARRETSWNRTTAMFASATVPANTSVSVLKKPLMTRVDVHKAHGHVRRTAVRTRVNANLFSTGVIVIGAVDHKKPPMPNAMLSATNLDPLRHVRVTAMFVSPRTVVKKALLERQKMAATPAPAAAVNGSVQRFHAPILSVATTRHAGRSSTPVSARGPAAQMNSLTYVIKTAQM